MNKSLEDIRVGDIMITPYDEERRIEQCSGIFAHVGDDRWFNKCDLRNPEFRVGDKVRLRTQSGGTDYGEWNTDLTPECWALVDRAPVSDTVKQERKAGFIIEAWKQWPEHKDDGSCTAEGCGVCAIDKAEDTVPDNKPFVKHDAAKPRMDLLPPLALKAMARVLTLGAAKYGDTNWRQIPREERSRLVASLLRHVTAAMAGEDLDPESGESHWAHAASNAAFLCELFELDKIAEDKFRR